VDRPDQLVAIRRSFRSDEIKAAIATWKVDIPPRIREPAYDEQLGEKVGNSHRSSLLRNQYRAVVFAEGCATDSRDPRTQINAICGSSAGAGVAGTMADYNRR
jgi:hypothetical protein